MAVDRELLRGCKGEYAHAVVAFLDEDGYPISVATDYDVDPDRGLISLAPPAGDEVAPPVGREVNVIFSHIRPQPSVGYDERRYVQFWGSLRRADGRLEMEPERAHTWDEKKLPFFQYAEVSVPQSHRYLQELGVRLGRPIRPRLGFGWLFLRATRLPFLTATLVPILVGIAVAANQGQWSLWRGFLTFLAGAFVHLGLNVANDVFDTMSGADAANETPTQFSGGSRVIHYGLVSLRTMALLSALFYAAGIGIGLYLAAITDFWPLFWLGAIGVAISIAYTAPPFRLVHRGIGEIAVALGFGPIMTLGAYFVQRGRFDVEAGYASIPIAILIALVLYVNEIPDRRGDAAAGKRTLPVRLSKDAVVGIYAWSIAVTYAVIAAGAIAGILARPTVIALVTIPLAIKAVRGVRENYDDPYALMPAMAKNIQLHLFTGMLLFVGYVIAILVTRFVETPPAFLV